MELKPENNPYSSLDRLITFVGVGCLLVGLGVLGVSLLRLYFEGYVFWSDSIDFDKTGQIGGFIGGVVGAIWSLGGVILFYGTVRLQKKSIEQQQEELQLQKEELKKSREIFSAQQLENTLFTLLRNFSTIRKEIAFDIEDSFCWDDSESDVRATEVSGVDFFQFLQSNYNLWYDVYNNPVIIRGFQCIISEDKLIEIKEKTPHIDNPMDRIKFKNHFFFGYYSSKVDQYLGCLEHVFSYIKSEQEKHLNLLDSKSKNDLSDVDTGREGILEKYQFYGDVVKTYLTKAELFVIFYYSFNNPELRELLNEYKVFDHLNSEHLADPKMHAGLM